MTLYLPIAELPLDVFLLLAIGAGVGLLSGMFGVGGGFLVTPLLIFFGVNPAVAAATGAAIVIAPSVSSALGQWRRRNVDLRMGVLLIVGGLIGSLASVQLVGLLRRYGQIDLVIALSYVILLGSVGVLMLVDAARAMRRQAGGPSKLPPARHTHYWVHGLPAKMRFPRSRLYVSAFLPLGVGFLVGILAGVMGVGGGFLLVPAMIYLIGMPTSVVVGTSLLQVVVVAANVTFLQAWQHQTVDILLAAAVTVGSLLAAPYGGIIAAKLRTDQLRGLMAVIVLAVALQLGVSLFAPPDDVFSVEMRMPGSDAPL
jgi:uncharacterized membrane protein YfcA